MASLSERLLVVADQLPYPPRNGATLPLCHYLVQLARTHEVRLALLLDDDERVDAEQRDENERRFGPLLLARCTRRGPLARAADELSGRGMFQHGWVAADTRDFDELAASDAGWCTAPVLVSPISALARWRAVRTALPRWRPRRTVVAVHDCTAAEYRWRWRSPQRGALGRAKAWSHWLRAPLVARAEAILLADADAVLVQTEADRAAMRQLVGADTAARTQLAPNGVRADLFDVEGSPGADARVLFVAELSGEYAPIAAWLCRSVWPRVRAGHSAATLTIVGRGADAAMKQLFSATEGLTHIEFAADLAPLYERSAVVWSPLWKGFGLINKTLEAMAAARPVVGGLAAFNGIAGFADGVQGVGLVRPDAGAMAAATLELLREPARAQALSTAARELVRDGFRWERTAEVIRTALVGSPALQLADGVPALGVPR
jgi:glycosyltransferase involved in cell wall biosynthesis